MDAHRYRCSPPGTLKINICQNSTISHVQASVVFALRTRIQRKNNHKKRLRIGCSMVDTMVACPKLKICKT